MDRVYQLRRERLRKAAHELFPGKGSQRQLAEHLGREPNYISRMLSTPDKKGHKRIGEELARQFERQLKKPAYWLDGILDDEREPQFAVRSENAVASGPDMAMVRYYPDVSASAGHGCVPVNEAVISMVEMARAILQRHSLSANDAALLQANGDSMRGTVDHGDMMLLNLADREPQDGRVYVVSVRNTTLVKRIQWIPGGVNLIADNPAYEAIQVLDEDQDTDIAVVGRVVMAWHPHVLLE